MGDKKLWFKNKAYGWGWVPATWEGWVVVGAYAVFVTAATAWITKRAGAGLINRPGIFGVMAVIIFASILLIAICYAKGERPRWRWGDKNPQKN